MTNRIKTRRLPVYAELTDEPDHVPDEQPILDQESWVNFWILSLMAIACLGFIGYGFGLFKTPSQAMEAQNQKLTQQLANKSSELETLKACLGK